MKKLLLFFLLCITLIACNTYTDFPKAKIVLNESIIPDTENISIANIQYNNSFIGSKTYYLEYDIISYIDEDITIREVYENVGQIFEVSYPLNNTHNTPNISKLVWIDKSSSGMQNCVEVTIYATYNYSTYLLGNFMCYNFCFPSQLELY